MNNQFLHLQGKVYKRYVKSPLSIITGYRVNPEDLSKRLIYSLETPEKDVLYIPDGEDTFKADKRASVDYDSEVLEVYSEEEDRLFRRLNRTHIENGLLVEYIDTLTDIDTSNELNDRELKTIAEMKNLMQFKKRAKEITSPHTLKRLLDMLNDRPKSFSTCIEELMRTA